MDSSLHYVQETFAPLRWLTDYRDTSRQCPIDLLTGKNDFESHYTLAEKERFEAYVEKQLEKIEIPNKDISFLREKLLLMYANPLTNYLAARQ